jgi:hypothetical protein
VYKTMLKLKNTQFENKFVKWEDAQPCKQRRRMVSISIVTNNSNCFFCIVFNLVRLVMFAQLYIY